MPAAVPERVRDAQRLLFELFLTRVPLRRQLLARARGAVLPCAVGQKVGLHGRVLAQATPEVTANARAPRRSLGRWPAVVVIAIILSGA